MNSDISSTDKTDGAVPGDPSAKTGPPTETSPSPKAGRLSFPPLVEQAFRLAAEAHREQTRKLTDTPYFAHPAAVVVILAHSGVADPHVLAAAALHDVIEDTDVDVTRLAREFPQPVVDLVNEVSERKTDSTGEKRSWEDRKQETINELADLSTNALMIVVADKLHNLTSLLFDLQSQGPAVFSKFGAPPDRLVWYHRSVFNAARARGDERLSRLAAEAEIVLADVECRIG